MDKADKEKTGEYEEHVRSAKYSVPESWSSPDTTPIGLLEEVKKEGRVWEELAEEYGVANPNPPWKTSLFATMEALSGCSGGLSTYDRRASEDELAETVYQDVPYPERELLALAHTMLRRGLVNEEELAQRMKQVEERLNSA